MRGTFEDEPAPEIGPGWVRRTKQRPKGQSGKRFDRYFLSPERHGQRRQFRSLVAAQAYHAGKLDELDAVCEACGSGVDEPGNDILLCDGCNAAHHMACLPVPLKAVPEGEWLCPACKGGPVGARPPKVRPGTIIVQKAAASPRAVTAARHSPGQRTLPRHFSRSTPASDTSATRPRHVCDRSPRPGVRPGSAAARAGASTAASHSASHASSSHSASHFFSPYSSSSHSSSSHSSSSHPSSSHSSSSHSSSHSSPSHSSPSHSSSSPSSSHSSSSHSSSSHSSLRPLPPAAAALLPAAPLSSPPMLPLPPGAPGEAAAGLRRARLPRRGRRPAAGALFQSREEAARGGVPVSHLLLGRGVPSPPLLPSPRPLPPRRRSSCSPATSAGRLGSALGGTATSLTAARPPPRQRQCRRRPRRRGVCPSPPILCRRAGRRA